MPSPIDFAKSLLETSPRDLEYIDLGDTSPWSPVERRNVADLLIDAAKAGDHRGATALVGLLSGDELEATLVELLQASQPSVRAAAGEALATLFRQRLQGSLYNYLLTGNTDDYTLGRIARLFLSVGDLSTVVQAITDTTDERVRTACLKALWRHFGLDSVPTVWWRGLGLMRWKLDLPLPSFRTEAQKQLVDLLHQPIAALPREDPATPMPAELRPLMTDARDGFGPVDPAPLAALSPELKDALTVFCATKALDLKSPRCLEYVRLLGGSDHVDLFELAAQSPTEEFAEIGKEIRDQLRAN